MGTTDNATRRPARQSVWVVGGAMFAATLLIMIGVFQVMAGMAALFENTFYVATQAYVFQFDVTTWGWVHLIFGIILTLTGVGAYSGAAWARGVGIALAALNAMVNFAFIPIYPLWALLLIGFDVFIIWALASYDPDALPR